MLLTGNRKEIFIRICKNPGISLKELCKYSIKRGGNISRINHHLLGLESEGFIEFNGGKSAKNSTFTISKGKGRKMLDLLQSKD